MVLLGIQIWICYCRFFVRCFNDAIVRQTESNLLMNYIWIWTQIVRKINWEMESSCSVHSICQFTLSLHHTWPTLMKSIGFSAVYTRNSSFHSWPITTCFQLVALRSLMRSWSYALSVHVDRCVAPGRESIDPYEIHYNGINNTIR